MWATMRRRVASSGSGPAAAAMFSRTWSIRVVAGIATVTAGWERMNFKMNWAQLEAPISSAQFGSASPCKPADQRVLAERPVDHHGDAAVARQRQEPLFGPSIEDVVGELHEIERVLAHDPLQ